jgi:PleD family two-component response regulator
MADRAMYRAKSGGKDRIQEYSRAEAGHFS